MKLWPRVGLPALQLLGALLAFFAFFTGAFASDSGELDPAGRRFSSAMLTVPWVYLLCLIASLLLTAWKRSALALTAAAFPFLYLVGALVYATATG